MKRTLIYAVIVIGILIALFIPAAAISQRNDSQPAQAPTATDDEPALHTPPATSTLASDITKTIAILETGGTLDCSKTGLSGEKGCHQFLPSTWKLYSTEVYGKVVEQTPAAGEYVTLVKVQGWIDDGFSPRQIFLIWNQGNAGQCKAGINWLGVPYDSCAYAQKALDTLQAVIHSR